MIHLALFQPEIPPNTGNIARLSIALGASLHIVGQPAFEISEKAVRRAGLDYWDQVKLSVYPDFQAFRDSLGRSGRLFLVSKYGSRSYTSVQYKDEDVFLFGNETSGLPEEIHKSVAEDQILRIPMQPNCRCLNLSNAAAVIGYEAMRQIKSW